MKKNVILLLIGCLTMCFSYGQDTVEKKSRFKKGKGSFFVYWGWNSSNYSDSDIHFTGDGYDFTLYDVAARDRQNVFTADKFLHPSNATLPQTNVRAGYFFHDKWNVTFGYDHMKYVMESYQFATIDGQIQIGSSYDGVYTNEPIRLDPEFLQFEHTDGLNYITIGINRVESLNDWFKLPFQKVQFELSAGIEGGILYPKTNTTLLGMDRYDQFHLTGYGVSGIIALNVTFFNRFFVQGEFKNGYINMPNIRTTQNTADKASQSFFFFERIIAFGYRFRL